MRKVFLDDLPKHGEFESRIDWKNSVGFNVKFIYDDIDGEFRIKKYEFKNNNSYLQVIYRNKEYKLSSSQIKKCSLGGVLSNINYDYIYQIDDMVKTKIGELRILNKIKIKSGNHFVKGYEYECQNDGFIGKITENNLNQGKGCPVCRNKKVLKGVNDLWSLNPHIANLLEDYVDGYIYTNSSNKTTNWKCPDCNTIIKNKRINSISTYGLSCPKCSDGVSYPEKFIFNILEQLSIEFERQYKFKWSKNKKYDFYIPSLSSIIETHGLQHYEHTGRGRSLQEEQENDKLKEQLAKENGIEHYIVIDCRESDLELIKNSVLNSKLAKLLNLSNINWVKCHEYACKSRMKEICELWNKVKNIKEISKITKLSTNSIRTYLKKGSNIWKWCNYNSCEEIIKNNIKNGERNSKKIVCLNTQKVFNSIKEAQVFYRIKGHCMTEVCRGERRYYGKDPVTGEPLKWMYYEDYIKQQDTYKKVI